MVNNTNRTIQKSVHLNMFPVTYIEQDGKYYQIQVEPKTVGTGDNRKIIAKEYVEVEGQKLYLDKNRKIAARQPGIYAQTETLENFEDMGQILNYFLEKEKYNYYLLFTLGCNMARRIGDLLKLKWKDFYNKDGTIMNRRRGTEQKTGKNTCLFITKSIADALKLYIEKENIDVVSEYDNPIFLIRHGQYKGNVVSYKAYWKALKVAEKALNLDCNIGAHTPRRTFGYMAKQLHPHDPLATNITMEFFNHSSERITNRYVGITSQKKNQYSIDFDNAFRKYALQGEMKPAALNKPIVTIDFADLCEIVKLAYECGSDNKENSDRKKLDDFKEIMEIIEDLIR